MDKFKRIGQSLVLLHAPRYARSAYAKMEDYKYKFLVRGYTEKAVQKFFDAAQTRAARTIAPNSIVGDWLLNQALILAGSVMDEWVIENYILDYKFSLDEVVLLGLHPNELDRQG